MRAKAPTRLYERLGAHPMTHEGVAGVHFAVWAPNAQRVSVVGDFNAWDGRRHVMRKRIDTGVWEIFVPALGNGALYKYEILGARARCCRSRRIPSAFARSCVRRPRRSSRDRRLRVDRRRVDGTARASAMRGARRWPSTRCISGSWRRGADGRWLTYDELAEALVPYVAGMGFTHIELLPVNEHPLDASWGYQPIGLFAPTRRFGEPAAFARFVDRMPRRRHRRDPRLGARAFSGRSARPRAVRRHRALRARRSAPGISSGLEHRDLRFRPPEVVNYLIANALFWLDRFHIDGLRVDAVASMLYLDYSRKPGEWVPNRLRRQRESRGDRFPAQAERDGLRPPPRRDRSSRRNPRHGPAFRSPTYARRARLRLQVEYGLDARHAGVHAQEPVHRRCHHDRLTFGLIYALTENFVLPLSHDEVVHGKGSLLARCRATRGSSSRRCAPTTRSCGAPGQEAAVHGTGICAGPRVEFRRASLDWQLLDLARIAACSRSSAIATTSIGRSERCTSAIARTTAFAGSMVDDRAAFGLRLAALGGDGRRRVAVIANFTPVPRERLPDRLAVARALARDTQHRCRDLRRYRSGQCRQRRGAFRQATAIANHASLMLPPLATLWLVHDGGADAGGRPRGPETARWTKSRTRRRWRARTMAYVLAGGRGTRLMELTERRAKPAVYFGGKSRIIDFALSNALNSGIRRIAVATQYKAHSLIRHLQRGWNFLQPVRNESFDILPASQRVAEDQWYAGTADAVYQNIDIIDSYAPEYHHRSGGRSHLQDGLRADARPARERRRRRHRRVHRGSALRSDGIRRDARRRSRTASWRSSRSPRSRRRLPDRPGLALAQHGGLRVPARVPERRNCAATRPTRTRPAISAATSFRTSCRTAMRSRTASAILRAVARRGGGLLARRRHARRVLGSEHRSDRHRPRARPLTIATGRSGRMPRSRRPQIRARRRTAGAASAVTSLVVGRLHRLGIVAPPFAAVHRRSRAFLRQLENAVILPNVDIGRRVRLKNVVVDARREDPRGSRRRRRPGSRRRPLSPHRQRHLPCHAVDDRSPRAVTRVLSVASEVYPLVKTGGLADVVGALPPALAREGVTMRTLVPGYPAVFERCTTRETVHTFAKLHGGPARLVCCAGGRSRSTRARRAESLRAPGQSVCGSRRQGLARQRDPVCGAVHALRWPSRTARSRASCRDVVQAHDWQAGLTPALLHYTGAPRPATVMTVHNLAFQGQFPKSYWERSACPRVPTRSTASSITARSVS